MSLKDRPSRAPLSESEFRLGFLLDAGVERAGSGATGVPLQATFQAVVAHERPNLGSPWPTCQHILGDLRESIFARHLELPNPLTLWLCNCIEQSFHVLFGSRVRHTFSVRRLEPIHVDPVASSF